MKYNTLKRSLTWVRDFPLRVETTVVQHLEGVDRAGTPKTALVVRLSGRRWDSSPMEEGLGEVVGQGCVSILEATEALDALALDEVRSLGEFLERVRKSRPSGDALGFALECAGLDLSLREYGQDFSSPVVGQTDAVRFVVTIGPDSDPVRAIDEYHAADSSLEFRLLACRDWGEAVWTALRDVSCIRTISLAQYVHEPGSSSKGLDGLLRLLKEKTDILVENPSDEALDALCCSVDRVCWDGDFKSMEGIKGKAGFAKFICIKPYLFGTLERLAEAADFCDSAGIKMYGGDQREIGPAREQHHALASGLYPYGPNDLAPYEYYSRPYPTGSNNPIEEPYLPKFGLRFRHLQDVDPWYKDARVGEKLEKRRMELGLEAADVAALMGRGSLTYQDIEHDGDDYFIRFISVETAKDISRALGLDLAALCGLPCSQRADFSLRPEERHLSRGQLIAARSAELGVSLDEVGERLGWGDKVVPAIRQAEHDTDILEQELSVAQVVELAQALRLPSGLLLGVSPEGCEPSPDT